MRMLRGRSALLSYPRFATSFSGRGLGQQRRLDEVVVPASRQVHSVSVLEPSLAIRARPIRSFWSGYGAIISGRQQPSGFSSAQ